MYQVSVREMVLVPVLREGCRKGDRPTFGVDPIPAELYRLAPAHTGKEAEEHDVVEYRMRSEGYESDLLELGVGNTRLRAAGFRGPRSASSGL